MAPTRTGASHEEVDVAAPVAQAPRRTRSTRLPLDRGLLTILAALVVLLALGAVLAPSSVSRGSLLGMLPFAAVLAVVALGQTLVVQQGGFDLSVPGAVSAAVVMVTHQPNGDDARLPMAVLTALGIAVAAGLLNGFLVSRLRLNSIVATLGMNALLYAVVLGVSNGSPRRTTDLLGQFTGGVTAGVPHALALAVVVVAIATVAVKTTVAGREFEAVGASAPAAHATGLPVVRHRASAYVWAQVLYCVAGIMLAGIVAQPTAFQGDAYLLPSVAAVVLGGTSLLGGRGHLVATAVAALFLTQLQQFVLALGVTFAIRAIVEAAALGLGVALYTVDWASVRRRFAALAPPRGGAVAPAP